MKTDDQTTANNFLRQAKEALLENKPVKAYNSLEYAEKYVDKLGEGNKTISQKDLDHLKFIYERMRNVHLENGCVDYMLKFKQILQELQTEITND